MRKIHPILITALAAVTIAACAKQDAPADSTAMRDSMMARNDSSMTGMRQDSAGGTVSSTGWSDGQILGFASAVDNGEIAEGKLASTKATNAGVKAFGRQLVTDHQMMMTEGKAFATKNNIMADTTKDDVMGMMKDGRDHLKELGEKAAGADWDKSFLDGEIDGHQKVLDRLQTAANGTSNADLRAMIVKASGKVQEHLTKAKALKEKYPSA